MRGDGLLWESVYERWHGDHGNIHFKCDLFRGCRCICSSFCISGIYKKLFRKTERIQYKKSIERYNIYGLVEWEYWNYKKDGTLSQKSDGHKKVKSMCSFYTSNLTNVDYKKWFELYTSVKVTITE